MLDLVRLLFRGSSVRLFTCNWLYLFFLSLFLFPPPSTHILYRHVDYSLTVNSFGHWCRDSTTWDNGSCVLFVKQKKKSIWRVEGFTGEVMFSSFIHATFSHLRRLPLSLSDASSDVSLEVEATGDQMKRTITLKKKYEFLCVWTFVETFGRL